MAADASEVTGALDGLGRYLRSSRELAPMIALRAMREAFDSQRDPSTGRSWAALEASTTESRSGPALNVSGGLRESLERGGRYNIWRVGRRAVQFGTGHPVGGFHQRGTRPHVIEPKRDGGVLAFNGRFAKRVNHPGIPARRFVGVSNATARVIERAMKTGSEQAMKRGMK